MARSGGGISRESARPVPEVMAALAGGVVTGLRSTPPPGALVGSVTDTRVRVRPAASGRRFPAVLELVAVPAGRGTRLSGRIRRSGLAAPLVTAMALVEVMFVLVTFLAISGGLPPEIAIAPVLYLLPLGAGARLLLSVPPREMAELLGWLDSRLAALTGSAARPGA
jgi:hypothetical protein